MFVLCDDSESNHVFDELIKTAWPEVAKTFGRFCSQAMTAMIVSVNNEFRVGQCLSQFGITTNVFAKSVGDLNDSANVALVSPFDTGDGKAVIALKLESLRCAHYRYKCQATARSWRAQAASRRSLLRILPEPLFGSSV